MNHVDSSVVRTVCVCSTAHQQIAIPQVTVHIQYTAIESLTILDV